MSFPGLQTPAHAQNKSISETEKAVFAFFKLSSITPDYAKWIESSREYKKESSMYGKQLIYEKESLRLKWGFGTFDPEEDFLKIKTNVYIQLTENPEPSLNFKFKTSMQEEVPYFPYQYGQEWIALVIEDLQNFTTVKLKGDEYAKVKAELKPDEIYDGKLHMRIKPMSSDYSSPMSVYGEDHWLLMGNIAYFELTRKNEDKVETTLWDFTAPWYLTKTEEELLPLLED